MITKVAFVTKHIFCDIFSLYISARAGGGCSFFSVAASRKIALKKLLTLKQNHKKAPHRQAVSHLPPDINCLAR